MNRATQNEKANKMRVALLHNHYDRESLESVTAEMRVFGAPTIKVLDLGFDDMYQALEGCHRLRAAEILGLTPIFEIIDIADADATAAELELDVDNPDARAYELGDWENYQIEFDCE